MINPTFSCLLKRLAFLAGLLVLLAHGANGALATAKYVQGNYAVPQTPEPTITVPFMATQNGGDLNVVVVGWNDSTAQVSSLTDSEGNVYQLAVGPKVIGGLSQSIYYANNISTAASGANVVTVTFSVAPSYPDVRISEYSGIDPDDPLDVVVGAAGNSATSSSGAVTTTNATDLLLGANLVQTASVGAGTGFTLRLLTSPDGDITEDQVVTAAGSYSASAPLIGVGPWVMQMVAFRVAGSAAPTPAPTPVPVTPACVQGNYASPQTPQTTITVPYTVAQKAGDLNVVIVGWSDSTTQLTALGDSVGNTYQLAVGPTVLAGTPGLSQVMVFANNISAAPAGANAVTLTFNAAATYPDVRILEYSGINSSGSLDVAMASTGNSGFSSSGSVTTTNAADLLVGANIVWSGTSGPGSGWTQRMLTSPDGDIAEDRVVTATGSYRAGAPLVGSGPWIMQMAAFRSAASGSTATPNPTPSQNLGSSVVLAWNTDSPTSNSGTNTAGYRLHWGVASGVYTQTQDAGNNSTATVSSLTSGTTYYFVVTAYNSAGVDSPPSNEISYTAP